MAYFPVSLVSLLSCLLLLLLHHLLHSCVAMNSETNCTTIPNLIDREPDIYIQSEASSFEVWNLNCDGLHVLRYIIQPNGLTLPFYSSGNEFFYFIQGELTIAFLIPRCSDGEKNECQQIYNYQRGDLGARHAGEIGWSINNGNESNIIISILRVTDIDGLRIFSLGGPQNILAGFSSDFTTIAFNIKAKLARKLQRKNPRGNTIYMTRGELHLTNVIDSSSYKTNNTKIVKLVDPPKADLSTTKVGYFTSIDAHEFPILESVKFSASYNLLLKDVMRLPHWENTYRIVYVVKGEGRIQVADDNGKNVFNDVIKEGQILVVPKFLVMAEKAKSEKFEYVTFKTNANPISYDISGRNAVTYALPLEVVTDGFKITEEEAKKVKFAREETHLAKT